MTWCTSSFYWKFGGKGWENLGPGRGGHEAKMKYMLSSKQTSINVIDLQTCVDN